jgi:protein subunit release factor B
MKQDEEKTDEDEGEPSRPKELPAWYTEGKYSRNPTKSKKEPLLLDTSHIIETFIRGSGPGGQAINKLSTCVQLKHTPTGVVIKCQDTRSRELNREYARRKLSKELEVVIFGDRDSVKGREALNERRKKMAKKRKRQRKLLSEK